jgi:hypothetical protein
MKYSLTLRDIITSAENRAKNYYNAKQSFISACRDYRRHLRQYNNSRDTILMKLLGDGEPRSSGEQKNINNNYDDDDDELLTEAFENNEELRNTIDIVRKANVLPLRRYD